MGYHQLPNEEDSMRSIILVFILTLPAVESTFAQGDFPHAKKIDALVAPWVKHRKANAISIGVISGGKTWTAHYGSLNGDGKQAPDDRTLYEIGSITKVFTSLLLADAVESGTLKLSDSISHVMTELRTKNPTVGESVTFQHLSHHNSGLPVSPSNIHPDDSTNPFRGYDRTLLTDYMSSVKPTRKPGEAYEYSNLAVGLLGDLLSRQSGISYGELLKQKITGPLKMMDTSVSPSAEQTTRVAPPFNAALLADRKWDFDLLAGCGAIRSTVSDMLLFMEASQKSPDGLLGKAIELAWKQHKPAKDSERAMGLGWMIAGDGSTRWHNGQTGGYQSMMLVSRVTGTAVVLLCNTAGSGVDQLGEQIFQAALGMNVKPKSFDEFNVDPKEAARFAGKYQLAPGVEINVQVKNGRMMAQLTGQQFLSLEPKSKTEWRYQLVDAVLEFELPKTGPSNKVTLHQNGRDMPAPRIKE